MALGESTTALGGDYSWPSQLEQILNEQSSEKKFIVVNGGASGTNTALILSNLEMNLDKYSPHFVITMMGANDESSYVMYENSLVSRIITQLENLRIYKLSNLIWATLKTPDETGRFQEEDGLKEEGRALKEDIQSDVSDARAYEEVGRDYEARGMYPEAIETYEKLLELSETGLISPGLDEWAYTRLGRLYSSGNEHDSNKLKKAEEMFKKALEINPNNGEAYVGLGWVYLHLGHLLEEAPIMAEAEEMFKNARELEVPSELLYPGLGGTYERRGMYPEAIETYEELIELSESGAINNRLEGWAYAKLGWLYHQGGVPDEEIEDFYKKTGVQLKVPRNTTPLEITKHHYKELSRVLNPKGIEYIAMQYPTKSVDDLKQMFSEDDDVTFVSNEENFRQALDEGRYEDYFIDRCSGDFGHATPKGNRLIAENVADTIINKVVMRR